MFVVNKARSIGLSILGVVPFVLGTYVVVGFILLCVPQLIAIIFWAGSYVLGVETYGVFLPYSPYTDAISAIWPFGPFLLAFYATLISWFASSELEARYDGMRENLAKINKLINQIPALEKKNRSVSDTVDDEYGPFTKRITYLGKGQYRIDEESINEFGTDNIWSWVFSVTKNTFESSRGASRDVLASTAAYLFDLEKYGKVERRRWWFFR